MMHVLIWPPNQLAAQMSQSFCVVMQCCTGSSGLAYSVKPAMRWLMHKQMWPVIFRLWVIGKVAVLVSQLSGFWR